MHPRHSKFSLTAGLALSLLAACGRTPLGTPSAPVAPEQSTQSASASLLVLMASALQQVAHGGQRHFWATWHDGTTQQELEYWEWVLANGKGNFLVDPIDLGKPPSTPAEKINFLLIQKVRERTMYLSRDFAVRDIPAFTSNYTLVDTGQMVQVAGVNAVRLEVEKRKSPDRRYKLDVDPSTGLILSMREELLDGTLVTLSEFTSLSYTPNLVGVIFNNSINSETSLPMDAGLAARELGFVPRTPKLLPDGWSLIGFAKLIEPGTQRVWARLTYSDGVEQILFVVGEGLGPKFQPKLPPPAGGPPGNAPDVVRKMAVGSWTLLEAHLGKGDVMVLGRAPQSVLYDLIQSAFF